LREGWGEGLEGPNCMDTAKRLSRSAEHPEDLLQLCAARKKIDSHPDFCHTFVMDRFMTSPLRFLLLILVVATQGFPLPCRGQKVATNPLRFSVQRGFYQQPFEVSISGPGSGSRIFFTTNNTVPDEKNGLPYTGPILVQTTTILMAASFPGSGKEIETHSYIFPEQVARQNGKGFPSSWGTNQSRPVVADYEMDPEIVNHPEYRDSVIPALKAIPSISLTMSVEDLFGPERGIYSNPEQTGAEWERPASMEYLEPGKGLNFQVSCGARIHGGWNRRPDESPKHAIRLVFKKKYGTGKLRQPVFGESAGAEFDTLVLRAGCNNTWLHWNGTERARGEFLRDQWTRDTMKAMGHTSPAGRFVHLYLNGLYWGLYNLSERPDAEFAAARLGGKAEDYDAMNASKAISGDKMAWDQLLQTINAGVDSEKDLGKVESLINMDAFIDYMILNFYGANGDWDRSSNWYAARRRLPPGKFQFFVWDAERTLEKVDDCTIDFDDDQSPPRIFQKLRGNPGFQRKFSDRVKIHFLGNGVLAPASAVERYRKLSDGIQLPVLAESARWGDYRRDVHRYKEGPYELYTLNQHWKPEVDRLLREYFPARSAAVLEQFRIRNLYQP